MNSWETFNMEKILDKVFHLSIIPSRFRTLNFHWGTLSFLRILSLPAKLHLIDMDPSGQHHPFFLLFLEDSSDKSLGFHIRDTGFHLKFYSPLCGFYPPLAPEIPSIWFELKGRMNNVPSIVFISPFRFW